MNSTAIMVGVAGVLGIRACMEVTDRQATEAVLLVTLAAVLFFVYKKYENKDDARGDEPNEPDEPDEPDEDKPIECEECGGRTARGPWRRRASKPWCEVCHGITPGEGPSWCAVCRGLAWPASTGSSRGPDARKYRTLRSLEARPSTTWCEACGSEVVPSDIREQRCKEAKRMRLENEGLPEWCEWCGSEFLRGEHNPLCDGCMRTRLDAPTYGQHRE